MTGVLVTRRALARELAFNAATRPLNIAVPAGVAVAAILLTLWLLPVAAVLYAALVVTSLLDANVAESVGREVYAKAKARGVPARRDLHQLAPEISEKVALAREAEQRIHRAVRESPIALPNVEAEVEQLMHQLEKLAYQADRVAEYLADGSEDELRKRVEQLHRPHGGGSHPAAAQAAAALQDQLNARAQLSRQLSLFDAQMEHIVATLGFMHAQILRASVAEEAAAQQRVAERVRDLRHEVDAAADALHQTYRELS